MQVSREEPSSLRDTKVPLGHRCLTVRMEPQSASPCLLHLVEPEKSGPSSAQIRLVIHPTAFLAFREVAEGPLQRVPTRLGHGPGEPHAGSGILTAALSGLR